MVKSKKLSRGSLAVFLLALVLACSLAVGVTGAWFTDSDSKSATNPTSGFGKVAVSVGANSIAAGATTNDISKLVDHDTIVITTGAVTNGSEVAIKYMLGYSFVLTSNTVKDAQGNDVSDATLKSWLGITEVAEGTPTVQDAAAAGTLRAAGTETLTLDSNGAANGCTGAFVLTVTLKVAAIQADHYSESALPNETNGGAAELAAIYTAIV